MGSTPEPLHLARHWRADGNTGTAIRSSFDIWGLDFPDTPHLVIADVPRPGNTCFKLTRTKQRMPYCRWAPMWSPAFEVRRPALLSSVREKSGLVGSSRGATRVACNQGVQAELNGVDLYDREKLAGLLEQYPVTMLEVEKLRYGEWSAGDS